MFLYERVLPHIYMLTLLIDTESFKKGTKYIGRCITGNKNYFTGGILPKQIIKKYSRKAFKREILVQDNFTSEELNDMEQFYIRAYGTDLRGLNLNSGGGIGRRQLRVVYQYTLDGVFVQEFASAELAARSVGVSRKSIQEGCRVDRGYSRNIGGYLWRYTKEDNLKAYRPPKYKVYQYAKSGNFIAEFSSPIKAAKVLDILSSNICKSVTTDGHVSTGGFRFTRVKYTSLIPFPEQGYWARPRLTYKYDLFGKFIEEYNSIKEAALSCGDKAKRSKIKEAEDRSDKSAYGFQWRSTKVDNCGVYEGGKGMWRKTIKTLV
jgi:hypothetical protein